MILLIDIGNTRIKWAALRDGELGPAQAAVHAQWSDTDCAQAFAALARPERVLVGNVGGERIARIVREGARSQWGLEPEFIQSSQTAAGVRNAYAEPWKLGVDRWLGMIGAFASQRGAVCVVSIGTAATFDAVDASGHHLGGLIVPGPNLMVSSLLSNTSEIARRTENGSIQSDVFADNTLGAIHQGALHALAALAERTVAAAQARLGEPPQLVLTGGAGAQVARLIGVAHVWMPDLVLRGLAALATERP